MAETINVGMLDIGLRVRVEEFRKGLQRSIKELREFERKVAPKSKFQALQQVLGGVFRSVRSTITGIASVVAIGLVPVIGLIKKIASVAFGAIKMILAAIGRAFGFVVNKIKWAMLAIGAAFAGTTYIGMQFEFAMKKVFARMGGESQMAIQAITMLTDRARELGRTTLFTAAQAASGMEVFARAGFDAAEVSALIGPTLKAAQANTLALATTADIAATVFKAFRSKIDTVEEGLDKITYAANNSLNTFEDLGTAFSYIGAVSGPLKSSFSELTAALGFMGDVGLKGSRAGTALRRVLLVLNNLSGPAQRKIKGLGLSLDDVSTKSHTLAEIVDTLNEAGLDLADTSAIIGIRGGPALSALMARGGDALRRFAREIDHSDGTVVQLARDMQDALHPQLTLLKSALSELAITLSSFWQDDLKNVVIELHKWVSGTSKAIKENEALAETISDVKDQLGILYALGKEISGKIWEGFLGALRIEGPKVIPILSNIGGLFRTINKGLTPASFGRIFVFISTMVRDTVDLVVKGIATVVAFIPTISSKIDNIMKRITNFTGVLIEDAFPAIINIMNTIMMMLGAVGGFFLKQRAGKYADELRLIRSQIKYGEERVASRFTTPAFKKQLEEVTLPRLRAEEKRLVPLQQQWQNMAYNLDDMAQGFLGGRTAEQWTRSMMDKLTEGTRTTAKQLQNNINLATKVDEFKISFESFVSDWKASIPTKEEYGTMLGKAEKARGPRWGEIERLEYTGFKGLELKKIQVVRQREIRAEELERSNEIRQNLIKARRQQLAGDTSEELAQLIDMYTRVLDELLKNRKEYVDSLRLIEKQYQNKIESQRAQLDASTPK